VWPVLLVGSGEFEPTHSTQTLGLVLRASDPANAGSHANNHPIAQNSSHQQPWSEKARRATEGNRAAIVRRRSGARGDRDTHRLPPELGPRSIGFQCRHPALKISLSSQTRLRPEASPMKQVHFFFLVRVVNAHGEENTCFLTIPPTTPGSGEFEPTHSTQTLGLVLRASDPANAGSHANNHPIAQNSSHQQPWSEKARRATEGNRAAIVRRRSGARGDRDTHRLPPELGPRSIGFQCRHPALKISLSSQTRLRPEASPMKQVHFFFLVRVVNAHGEETCLPCLSHRKRLLSSAQLLCIFLSFFCCEAGARGLPNLPNHVDGS